jgi:PAS domain S-box-containing protein
MKTSTRRNPVRRPCRQLPVKVTQAQRVAHGSACEMEERFRALVETSTDWIWEVNAQGVYTYASPRVNDLLGYRPEEVIGKTPLDLMPAEEATRLAPIIRRKMAKAEPFWNFENLNRHKTGHLVMLETSGIPVFNSRGALRCYRGIDRDITARKQAEAVLGHARDQLKQMVSERTRALERTNHIFRMISQCNKALVRVSDEGKLMQKICRIVTGIGGYKMAWVGFAEADEAKSVRPVAAVGFEQDYLRNARITWANNRLGRGPTGTAIRTGAVCLGRDFLKDSKLIPWRELALRHGFRSSIALPLKSGGRAFGSLTIYATKPRAFDRQQIGLLTDLAEDLSFGITVLRARADTDRTRKELERTTTQLRALAGDLAQAEQRERRRIARVLHDRLQQLLVGARYGVESLRSQGQGQTFEQAIQRVDDLLAQSLETSRGLTVELSPPVLHEEGLPAALKWLAGWFRENHGLSVKIVAGQRSLPDSEDIRITLFEAVRELLFNVVKHAKVGRAQVRLFRIKRGRLKIVVSDSGAGFDPAKVKFKEGEKGGFGLFSLRERLALLGGNLEVASAPGCGSSFTLLAPIRGAAGRAGLP